MPRRIFQVRFSLPKNSIPRIDQLFDPSLDADIVPLIRKTEYSHIDVLPTGCALTNFDVSDQTQWEQSDLHFSLIEPITRMRNEYELIVFDCPPRLSVVSFAALCASDGVIIPMEAADWGAQGIMHVTGVIEYVQKHYNPRLRLLGYLVSRFKRTRRYQQSYLKQLRTHFGSLAFDSVVPDLALFERSVTDRIPITLYAPESQEANIARDFFDEVQTRLHSRSQRRSRSRSHTQRKTIAAI